MTPFQDNNPHYKPCISCKQRMIPSKVLYCYRCAEDKNIAKFLAPFKVPEGKLLDDHLFPISIKEKQNEIC